MASDLRKCMRAQKAIPDRQEVEKSVTLTQRIRLGYGGALALTLCIVVVVILTADVCCRRPRRLPEYVGMPMELVDFGPVVCPADSEEDVQRFRNKAGTSCDDGASTSNQPD
ncbi:hypothetical protein MAR_017909 [Mya arenaria]|uniref:Uncharacterized protein n=1 Tax=Mya arenaria TaxID=6604 RepID=A0ABY7EGM4_MYAAR|nr:hypothetical protein MAR_017909 [Mya arenaria]